MLGFLLFGTAVAQVYFYQDYDGRVMYQGGYVCDDGIGQTEADMICVNMGYTDGADEYETSATITASASDYSMTNLNCGTSAFQSCTYTTTSSSIKCEDNEAVKVCCDDQYHSWDCDMNGTASAAGVIFGLLCCCCCYCVIPGVIIFLCIRGQQQHNQNRINANQMNQQNNTYTQPPPATQMATANPPPAVYSQAPTGQQPYVATQAPATYASPPVDNYAAPPPQAYNQPPQAYNQPPQAYAQPPQAYAAPPDNNAPPAYGAPPPAY